MEQTRELIETTDATDIAVSGTAVTREGTPAERIRSLLDEAELRGAPMVSAQAMQAKLFTVYDDASAVPDALALVQRHLGLTLDRTWYSADEVERLAGELDMLLSLDAAVAGAAGEAVAEESGGGESGVGDAVAGDAFAGDAFAEEAGAEDGEDRPAAV